ncbi:hypothetical protein QJQ45_029626, partial [Haematococcus lacustris]
MRGDIADPAGLRELINTTAFKSELIFTIMTDDISYAVPVVHMHLNMLKLGFEHFFLLSQSEAGCTNLYSAYEGVMPLPTCVWDSFKPPPKTFNVLELLWHYKHRMLLRLTRLGVNVLYMDSDTMLLDNPYKYLKAPGPFADVRYLGTVETTTGIQASFFYMQNVAPDGPISWMMWDIVEMGLRWQDDNRTLISSWGVQKPEEATMMSFDQNYWDDAFVTSMFGQEVRPCVVNALYGDKMVINNKNMGRAQVDMQLSHYRSYKRQDKDMFTRTLVLHPDGPVRPPAHRSGLTDEPIGFWDVMASFQLRVPNISNPLLLEGLGALPYYPPPGQHSRQLQQLLRDDCPACPWWQDGSESARRYAQLPAGVEGLSSSSDGSSGSAPRRAWAAGATELMAFAPAWFHASAGQYGMSGTWSMPHGKPRQVLAHIHRLQPHYVHGYNVKTGMYKMHGRFNWSLTQTLHRARRMNNGMFGSGRAAEPLLALAPWVPLHNLSSLEQYHNVVGGLMKAAFVLGRTAVIPDLPVTLPWLHKGGQVTTEAPLNLVNMYHPHAHPPHFLMPATFWPHADVLVNLPPQCGPFATYRPRHSTSTSTPHDTANSTTAGSRKLAAAGVAAGGRRLWSDEVDGHDVSGPAPTSLEAHAGRQYKVTVNSWLWPECSSHQFRALTETEMVHWLLQQCAMTCARHFSSSTTSSAGHRVLSGGRRLQGEDQAPALVKLCTRPGGVTGVHAHRIIAATLAHQHALVHKDFAGPLPQGVRGGPQGAGGPKVAEGGVGRRLQAQETQAPADQPLQVVKVTQKELQDLGAAANVKDQLLVYLGHPVDMFEALPDANAEQAFTKDVWPRCTSRCAERQPWLGAAREPRLAALGAGLLLELLLTGTLLWSPLAFALIAVLLMPSQEELERQQKQAVAVAVEQAQREMAARVAVTLPESVDWVNRLTSELWLPFVVPLMLNDNIAAWQEKVRRGAPSGWELAIQEMELGQQSPRLSNFQ